MAAAATLEIQFLADVAKLQSEMREVQKLVGDTGNAVSRAGTVSEQAFKRIEQAANSTKGGVKAFSYDVRRLKAEIDPAWASAQKYEQHVRLLDKALRQGAITQDQYNRQLASAAANFDTTGKTVVRSTGLQQAGMQQLSFQLGDMATMYSMNATPMRIFATQGTQVAQAVGMMSGQSKGLIGLLGGPWGMAMIAAATVAGTLATQLSQADKEADEFNKTLREMRADADGASAALQRLAGLQKQSVAGDITMTQMEINKRRDELSRLEMSMAGTLRGGSRNTRYQSEGDLFGGNKRKEAQQRAQELRWELVELEGAVNAGKYAMKEMAEAEREAAKSVKATGSAVRSSTAAIGSRKVALTEVQKAQNRQTDATLQFIAALEDEIAKIGLDAAALRGLEVARQMEAAQTEVQKTRIRELSAEREKALKLDERLGKARQAANDNTAYQDELDALQREYRMRGMIGAQREIAIVQAEMQADRFAILGQITEAELAGEIELVAELRKRLKLLGQIANAEIDGIQYEETQRRNAKATELVNDELREMIGLLENVGGMGTALGGLLGVLTGNTSAIGGPLGDLLNIKVGMGTDERGDPIAQTLGDELSKVFGRKGVFGETLADVFGAAGTGLLAGNALFGRQSFGEQMGSSLGGIAGKVAGEAIGQSVGGLLGKAGGPLGSLVGGALGGLVGKLFAKKQYGGAVLTGPDSVSEFGNDSSRRSAAGSLAGEVLAGLQNIADQFGAEIGAFSTSIGVYRDKFRVSTTGSNKLGGYKGSEQQNEARYGLYNFGEDAASAVKFAIADAVKDGALLGLRASTKALLQKDGDIERQLQKALDFEGVFKRYKELTDPLGFALDNLFDEFDRLIDIFKEAGATAEEFATLEKLYGLERAKVFEQQAEKSVSSLKALFDDLTIGNPALSLRTRQANALAEYNDLKGRVESGDTSAYDDYANIANDLLAIERDLFGSTKRYYDRLNEVTDVARSRIEGETNVVPIDDGRRNPFGGDDAPAITNAVERQTGELASHLSAINDNLIRLGEDNQRFAQERRSQRGPALHYARPVLNY